MPAPPKPSLFSGLDLGQTSDPSAMAVLEKVYMPDPARPGQWVSLYAVRHLKRWPLGTGYPQIVDDLVGLFGAPPLAGTALAIDQTGVGRPVVDMVRRARVGARLWPVTITAGHTAAAGEEGEWTVPKKDLVGTVQALLGQRRLKIAPALAEAEMLAKELSNFQMKITLAANEVFGAWREGQHDDLVLAVATAAWVGERCGTPGGWVSDDVPDDLDDEEDGGSPMRRFYGYGRYGRGTFMGVPY